MKASAPIYTLDIETDPFKYGRRPKAFAVDFYDGEKHASFWGSNCIEEMQLHLDNVSPGLIYIHNGGKFDILGYCMEWVIGNPMRVINNRIVKSQMKCKGGHHELRDSYSIMPFRLGDYKGKRHKLEIAIGKMEANEIWCIKTRTKTTSRELYKDEIKTYLEADTESLRDLCVGYIELYGLQLTIGGTAMKELRKLHSFDTLTDTTDAELRSTYFFGGRVECLKQGILHGDWRVYDVNSMYPHVMKTAQHPIGQPSWVGCDLEPETCFLTVTGTNYGAFPTRKLDGGLTFGKGYGTFHVTRHEFDAAMECKLFDLERIEKAVNFEKQGNFADFVETFYQRRQDAKNSGDEITAMLTKFCLNSAYGKFAQSPENYKDYMVTSNNVRLDDSWEPSSFIGDGEDIARYIVWSKQAIDASRFNVATGASITGAARAILMRAIAVAQNPIYCDTDSLVCETLPLKLDEKELGAWKLEAKADRAAIAGKKLYALFNGDECVKIAHKGVKITAQQIVEVCEGHTVESFNMAPTFKLDGRTLFVKRRVKMRDK